MVELLKSNKGCKLPCFWGITPKQTSWDDAKSFLETFSDAIHGTDVIDSKFKESIYFVQNDKTRAINLYLGLAVDHNLVQDVFVSSFDAPSYHLAEFLSSNGAPDQIWLLTFSKFIRERGPGVGADIVPFPVYLFYKDAKMIVAYGEGLGDVKGNQITGCIEGSPSLYMSASDTLLNFQELAELGKYYQPGDTFLEISEATEGKMDAKKFFETFRHPGVKACIQTPKELWPAN
jgi:hypothetical protein